MNDREFLLWLHHRLEVVHHEDPLFDYMHQLRAIILSIPPDQTSKSFSGGNSIEELMVKLYAKTIPSSE